MSNDRKTKSEISKELVKLKRRISELEEIELQLEKTRTKQTETSAFLRNIIESSSSISIISTDLAHNILYWNSGAENIFGYKADEVVGKKIDLLYPRDEPQATTRQIRSDVFDSKTGVTTEIREITKDGRELWINMTLTPRTDPAGKLIGILGIGEDITERKIAEEELQVSLEKLRKSLEGIICAMVLTVETRDPYTAGHQRRVADLSIEIAREMGLSEDEIDGIDMAGVVHDLGKISIPAEILSKPGPLTEIQFAFIKTHPEIGYDILKQIEFPWPIAEIALQHHERMDGSGYPHGLAGDDILLDARILSVADVVEAMASHRPYRPALGIDAALEEIKKFRGRLYDEDVVDACVKVIREKGFTFQ